MQQWANSIKDMTVETMEKANELGYDPVEATQHMAEIMKMMFVEGMDTTFTAAAAITTASSGSRDTRSTSTAAVASSGRRGTRRTTQVEAESSDDESSSSDGETWLEKRARLRAKVAQKKKDTGHRNK